MFLLRENVFPSPLSWSGSWIHFITPGTVWERAVLSLTLLTRPQQCQESEWRPGLGLLTLADRIAGSSAAGLTFTGKGKISSWSIHKCQQRVKLMEGKGKKKILNAGEWFCWLTYQVHAEPSRNWNVPFVKFIGSWGSLWLNRSINLFFF